jgi:hypothetical protein
LRWQTATCSSEHGQAEAERVCNQLNHPARSFRVAG